MAEHLKPLQWSRAITKDPHMDSAARLVAFALAQHMTSGVSVATKATVADWTALNEKTVQRALRQLERGGWIRTERTRGRDGHEGIPRHHLTQPPAGHRVPLGTVASRTSQQFPAGHDVPLGRGPSRTSQQDIAEHGQQDSVSPQVLDQDEVPDPAARPRAAIAASVVGVPPERRAPVMKSDHPVADGSFVSNARGVEHYPSCDGENWTPFPFQGDYICRNCGIHRRAS